MQLSGQSPALSSGAHRQSRAAELFTAGLETVQYLLRYSSTRIAREGRQTRVIAEGINSDLFV